MKRLAGAFALGALSLFMLTGYLRSDIDGSAPAAMAAFALVVLLPGVGALLLARSHFAEHGREGARKEELRLQTIESEVLKLAVARGGKLAAVEVATQLALSPEQATEALDRLALRGQAEYEVTDAGVIVYAFRDILHLGGKASAKGVLDA
jgi:hypothetical protein